MSDDEGILQLHAVMEMLVVFSSGLALLVP